MMVSSAWASLAPSVRRARLSESIATARLSMMAASRSARSAGSAVCTSSCTITPLSASRPSIRAGAKARVFGDLLCDLDRRGQRRGIDPEAARALLRLKRQRGLKIAAAEALIGEHPGRGLDAVEPRRRAQPELQTAAIDALDLPAPAQGAARAMRIRKTRHADDRHGSAPDSARTIAPGRTPRKDVNGDACVRRSILRQWATFFRCCAAMSPRRRGRRCRRPRNRDRRIAPD